VQKLRYIGNTSMVLEKVSDIGKIRDDQGEEDEGEGIFIFISFSSAS